MDSPALLPCKLLPLLELPLLKPELEPKRVVEPSLVRAVDIRRPRALIVQHGEVAGVILRDGLRVGGSGECQHRHNG